jgi:D-lactate dehydrogenase (cytochrome)
VNESDEKEILSAEKFRDEMARMALKMDGTCTGEHGVGFGKMHLLKEELGPDAINVMKKLKETLDPNNILNPGKVFGTLPASTHTHTKSKI